MRGRGYHERKGVPTHLPQVHVHRPCPPCHPHTSGSMDHMEEGGVVRLVGLNSLVMISAEQRKRIGERG